MMTHVFDDIATATRIESTAKTMSVSSTLTTVGPERREPEGGPRLRNAAPFFRVSTAEEVLDGQVQQVRAPTSFTQPNAISWHREHRRKDAEREGADDARSGAPALLLARQAEHEEWPAPARCRR
jgi:hypothetical protein